MAYSRSAVAARFKTSPTGKRIAKAVKARKATAPSPSARAMTRANAKARFKRTTATPFKRTRTSKSATASQRAAAKSRFTH